MSIVRVEETTGQETVCWFGEPFLIRGKANDRIEVDAGPIPQLGTFRGPPAGAFVESLGV